MKPTPMIEFYTPEQLDNIRKELIKNNKLAMEEAQKRGYKPNPRIVEANLK
jgi:hypothetical protein